MVGDNRVLLVYHAISKPSKAECVQQQSPGASQTPLQRTASHSLTRTYHSANHMASQEAWPMPSLPKVMHRNWRLAIQTYIYPLKIIGSVELLQYIITFYITMQSTFILYLDEEINVSLLDLSGILLNFYSNLQRKKELVCFKYAYKMQCMQTILVRSSKNSYNTDAYQNERKLHSYLFKQINTCYLLYSQFNILIIHQAYTYTFQRTIICQ